MHEDAVLVPIEMGTNMAAGNQQRHLSLSFPTKKSKCISRGTQKIKIILFSNTWTVQTAKFREISYFLKKHDSSCGRHVIATSSTEIKRRLS